MTKEQREKALDYLKKQDDFSPCCVACGEEITGKIKFVYSGEVCENCFTRKFDYDLN